MPLNPSLIDLTTQTRMECKIFLVCDVFTQNFSSNKQVTHAESKGYHLLLEFVAHLD